MTIRCRRCQMTLDDDTKQCPACGAGPFKALIHLGEFPNGFQVNLYLDQDTHGPQIAVLNAILAKFTKQGQALEEIRTLAAAWADPSVGEQIIAVIDNLT